MLYLENLFEQEPPGTTCAQRARYTGSLTPKCNSATAKKGDRLSSEFTATRENGSMIPFPRRQMTRSHYTYKLMYCIPESTDVPAPTKMINNHQERNGTQLLARH